MTLLPHVHIFRTVHLFGHRPLGYSALGLPLASERVLQRCRCGQERERARKIWTTEDQLLRLQLIYAEARR